ncbi:hypothetical protein Tco_1282952 [Tanacetum coccineum]
MAVLDSCLKHNMVAYLEKSEGNEEFHDIIDFLKRSSIHFALTVSPTVSTTFVEQFWTSAKSKTINNVRHITAKVARQFCVPISEASIRSDLRFDDADGIDTLPNQPQLNAIQQMWGNEIGIQCSKWTCKIEGGLMEQVKDDETIAIVLLNMSQAKAVSKEKEKGVELKDKIEEEDESKSEDDGIYQAEKKFKQLESDEELARKVQEEWEAEEEDTNSLRKAANEKERERAERF